MAANFGLRLGGRSGSAPSPFDALNGPRLAGAQGSHPLHSVAAEELLRPTTGAVMGQIMLDQPARVGDGITGRIRLKANKAVTARKAYLRLVGLRLDEIRRSEDHTNSKGEVEWTEHWVETSGTLFSHDAFLEPPIPTQLAPTQEWEAAFAIPAPPLGPPSAHLGESIIAWALEVRWDVPMGSDHFVAFFLPLAQHPDLLRAGIGKQGGSSLIAAVVVGDGTISVTSPLPAEAGQEVAVKVSWPSAPAGQGARIELHRRTNAPNGEEGIIASAAVAPGDIVSGAAEAQLFVPAGSAPSFDGAGLQITYIIRVLIDIRFRSDAAIERPLGVV
ncbi:MAG TPA: hypothetical protein VF337_11010 [Candidatus Limnocylindrales bacterium]